MSQFVTLIAMTSSIELLSRTLKDNGYSVTKSRLTLFQALEHSEPLSMNYLVRAVSPSVNRASVYRVVALFEQLGVVQRLQFGWKYKLELSNDFQEHHHHLTCVHCGKLLAFKEPLKLQQILAEIASSNDFVMQQHQLELQGICQRCATASQKS